jgi:hypothetical protein
MANDKNFKVKNGLQAGRYLHQSSPLVDPYEGVTIRPVFHYDMIANVYTADLQLDDISFSGTTYEYSTNSGGFETTIVDTPISNYSSASWFPVNTGTVAGRVNRDSGGTPSTGTGRTDAVSDTFYLYFETTAPANSINYDFLLRGEEQELTATPTFSFYEARNGTSLGNLNVYVDVVESPWASIPAGLTSQLLQTTGDVDAWVQKTVPMDLFYRPPGSKVVDLKRAQHFNHTLTENTTLYFENPPPSGSASSFALEITGADVTVGYDLANAAYDSVSFSVASQETNPEGLFVSTDGTKMYIVGITSDAVFQYSLSTANDLSTASYDSVSFSTTSQTAVPSGLFFKPDGTKMYINDQSAGVIYEYNLSTAWDISSTAYSNNSINVSTQSTDIMSVEFKPDGTKMYLIASNQNVYQYSLSTAWDVSTVSYDSVSFSVSSQETTPESVRFSSDGAKMFVVGQINDAVYQYNLSTAWDLSTASYSNTNFYIGASESSPHEIAFSYDGTKMFIVGKNVDSVTQYTTSASAPATVTYPSSVKWSGATTPDAPAAGEKDLYLFVTTDGGTTYYGKQAGDALA